MTTYVEARSAIIGLIDPAWSTAYPTVKLFYENTVSVDLDAVGDSFATVSIDFQDSIREDIDANPISKTWGVVTFRLFQKDGFGTVEILRRFDWITNLMKYKRIAGVTLECPRPGKKSKRDGWTSSDLIVDFNFWQ